MADNPELEALRNLIVEAHAIISTSDLPIAPRRSRACNEQMYLATQTSTRLHITHRTSERIALPMVQAAHPPDVRLQQEVGQPESSTRATLRVLQLLPCSQVAKDSGHGGGDHGSCWTLTELLGKTILHM